ncbi:MAG: hypothetical protein ACW99J_20300 [Candidatus Thorarchaeota archaeon]
MTVIAQSGVHIGQAMTEAMILALEGEVNVLLKFNDKEYQINQIELLACFTELGKE